MKSPMFKWNKTNLVKDEPIESSSHSDCEENIGQISSVKQQKLQHCLEQEEGEEERQRQKERETNITSMIYMNILTEVAVKDALPPRQ